MLLSIDSLCREPVCLWFLEKFKKAGTSTYVQGVEVSAYYAGTIPEGFEIITLPEADYLMFQSEPFAEEDYCDAIAAVQTAMEQYDPAVIWYQWEDGNSRIQFEPRGERGYIELKAVHVSICDSKGALQYFLFCNAPFSLVEISGNCWPLECPIQVLSQLSICGKHFTENGRRWN